MRKKIIIGVVALVILCVLGYFGYAYMTFQKNNAQYGKNLTYDAATGDYTLTTENEVYYYAPYPWWQIGGSLGINSTMRYGTNNQLMNEYYIVSIDIAQSDYVVRISLGYKDKDGTIKTVSYELNEKMEFVNPEEVSTVQEALFETMRPRILELYKKIYDTWGIFNPDEVDT